MKKLSIFVSLLSCLLSKEICAQSVLAGQVPINGIYVDIIPDTTITSIKNIQNEKYDMDLNNDGQSDFQILTYNYGGLGGGSSNILIHSFDSNEVSLGYIDTCFAGPLNTYVSSREMCKAFNLNDTIDKYEYWTKNDFCTLSYGKSGVHWDSLQGNISYSCYAATFSAASGFIGIRLISNDTLYGWIKVKNTTSIKTTIESFACEMLPVTINTFTEPPEFDLYPNPCRNQLNIGLSSNSDDSGILYIQNIYGQVVIKSHFKRDKLFVNTAILSIGVYQLILKYPDRILSRKFVKVE